MFVVRGNVRKEGFQPGAVVRQPLDAPDVEAHVVRKRIQAHAPGSVADPRVAVEAVSGFGDLGLDFGAAPEVGM